MANAAAAVGTATIETGVGAVAGYAVAAYYAWQAYDMYTRIASIYQTAEVTIRGIAGSFEAVQAGLEVTSVAGCGRAVPSSRRELRGRRAMITPGDIDKDPLARAVLAKLAETRSGRTPLGSFARTVLDGHASLREASGQSWHGEALQQALAEATQVQRGMPAEHRAAVEREAQRLREAGDDAHDIGQTGSEAGNGGE